MSIVGPAATHPIVPRFNVTATTSAVHLPDLCPKRQQRLEEMMLMKKSGMTTRQITDTLNQQNKRTFTGKEWTTKLVFMNLQKWEKRLERLNVEIEFIEDWDQRPSVFVTTKTSIKKQPI